MSTYLYGVKRSRSIKLDDGSGVVHVAPRLTYLFSHACSHYGEQSQEQRRRDAIGRGIERAWEKIPEQDRPLYLVLCDAADGLPRAGDRVIRWNAAALFWYDSAPLDPVGEVVGVVGEREKKRGPWPIVDEAGTPILREHVVIEEFHGCTDHSITAAMKHARDLGRVTHILAELIGDPQEQSIRIIGERGSIRFGGFAWGYGGTGPTGLRRTLVMYGVSENVARAMVHGTEQDKGWGLQRNPNGNWDPWAGVIWRTEHGAQRGIEAKTRGLEFGRQG